MKIYNVFFSPSNTTYKSSKLFCKELSDNVLEINLIKESINEEIIIGEDELLVLSLPVFAGRIPETCIEDIKKIKSRNSKAVILAVYGNRDYDDALVEMEDLLKENSFRIVGAGAVVAQHSIFPKVAKNRPDEKDALKLKKLAELVSKRNSSNEVSELKIKGNRPYKERGRVGYRPTTDYNCNLCGKCVEACPVNAISIEEPNETDNLKCIACTACIYVCPQNARAFRGDEYSASAVAFGNKCSIRKETEIF